MHSGGGLLQDDAACQSPPAGRLSLPMAVDLATALPPPFDQTGTELCAPAALAAVLSCELRGAGLHASSSHAPPLRRTTPMSTHARCGRAVQPPSSGAGAVVSCRSSGAIRAIHRSLRRFRILQRCYGYEAIPALSHRWLSPLSARAPRRRMRSQWANSSRRILRRAASWFHRSSL